MSKQIVNLSKPVFKMPAGKYYVGDPCYCFNDNWHRLLNATNYFDFRRKPTDNELPGRAGNAIIFDEHPVAAFDTEHGDGSYRGSDGFCYGVDAGLLGVVAFELIERPMEEVERLGTIIEFETDFLCSREEGGTIHLGHITIPTGEYASGEDDDDISFEEAN